MNGQISDKPFVELVREISAKRLSGRLRVQQNRVAVVLYFKSGALLYAATNVRKFRLREYLIQDGAADESKLTAYDSNKSDLDLAKQLISQNIVSQEKAQQLQMRQVLDILRGSLSWTEGAWDFDSKSHLNEEVGFTVNLDHLLLEVGRRLPPNLAATRLTNFTELISRTDGFQDRTDLLPTEVFLLSRIDEPISLNELVAIGGQEESETIRLVYALALSGLIDRQHWKSAFRNGSSAPAEIITPKPEPIATQAAEVKQPSSNEVDAEALEGFINRLSTDLTHYQVLQVDPKATPAEIKKSYYDLARRYHPDRFRKESDPAQHARIETAFAKITQAYDTLRDDRMRSTYDSKLDAQARARALSNPSSVQPVKSDATPPKQESSESARSLTDQDRAENHFNEGFAAKQLGQINTAIGLLSSAARLVPHEARYRAYYGQALAAHASTRRLAEAELQAAVKLDPSNSDFRLMLAELYRDLGFSVRARSELDKVLKAAPNNQKARELLRMLQ